MLFSWVCCSGSFNLTIIDNLPSSYDWVVPVRSQQDCVLDQNRDGSSELLAITTDMECRWYTVSEKSTISGVTANSEGNKLEKQEDGGGDVKLELMATLKTAELCNKLRKMDFRELIDLLLLPLPLYTHTHTHTHLHTHIP